MNKHILAFSSLAFASALAFSSAPAFAQNAAMMQARSACQADVKALCPNVSPGGGRIMECLKSQGDKVSSGCRAALTSAAHAQPH